MTLLLMVLLVALVFEYINGFHDTANSIATVVSTKVLTPRAAIILAAVTNLWGALAGTAVAKTISSGLVSASFIDSQTLIAALLLGVIESITATFYGPSWAPAVSFGLLLLTLAVRPSGLLGR